MTNENLRFVEVPMRNEEVNMEGRMKILSVVAAVAVFMVASGAYAAGKMVHTKSGLAYEDVKVGTGKEAKSGNTVLVDYTGWLDEGAAKGKKFDSSHDRSQPFSFMLGGAQVIKGWDEGVSGMKVGGKRMLYIPPSLAYGERGAGSAIPPNADLIFEVDLLEVK
jgi:peptidylprolyl isomerase